MEPNAEKPEECVWLSSQLAKKFQALGCDDEIKCGIAIRVFTDLLQSAQANRIDYHYNSELQRIYFVGKIEKDGTLQRNVYVPVSYYDNVNFHCIENLQSELDETEANRIILCITDVSGTVIYYRMTKGFEEKIKETPSIQIDIEEK